MSTGRVLEDDSGGLPWAWIIGGALLALLGGAAAWLTLRQRAEHRPIVVPQVERPRTTPLATAVPTVAPEPPRSPPPVPMAATGEPLQLTLEPLRLSLTLINATLSYRLEVANHGARPLEHLQIGADMISAHASMSREEQLAGPGAGTPALQVIERLQPGESRIVEGEFRLPFGQIVPIRQGNAAMLLPLARFRAQAQESAAVVRTFAVGQSGASGLQPFRLDQGPRVYPRLAQRAFA